MRPIFVASPVEVYHGADAAEKLQTTNDAAYMTEDGILSVSQERWEAAQKYERETWMEYNLGSIDDRNGEHRDGFDGYQVLPENLGRLLELGCGPFTNARLILEGRVAETVVLVDPLLNSYLKHPNCAYNEGGVLRDAIQVCVTAEDFEPQHGFDTVVVINVLAHCYDANKVLDTIRKALRPGGLLIWHEPPREYDAMQHWDVGHPIAPHAGWLDHWLTEFEELYRKGTYFIGRRLPVDGWTEPMPTVSTDVEELPFAVLYEDEPEPEEKPDPEPPKPKAKRTRKPKAAS